MAKTRDWEDMRTMSARLLEERTGEGVAAWNRRIQKQRFEDEGGLRTWLTKQGVMGYDQTLLVMERFGYPDFLTATADELIDGQYADRLQLRPIFDAVIAQGARDHGGSDSRDGMGTGVPHHRGVPRAARFRVQVVHGLYAGRRGP